MTILILVTVGCYGYERQTSPNFDTLAEEGVLFEQSMMSKKSKSC